MIPLATTVLTAILWLMYPPKKGGDSQVTLTAPVWVENLAQDIARASQEASQPLDTPMARALALVAIARTESGFAADVLACQKRGNQGEVTAFQLMPNRRRTTVLGIPIADLCPTNILAAKTALVVLDRPCARHGKNLGGMFRGYASGRCDVRSDVATKQYDTFVQLKLRYEHE